MLHKSKLHPKPLPKKSCVSLEERELFHPLSYYLNGGIDLTGQALDKSADVEFDNEEQIAELDQEGAMSVPYGDPRMSKFRLVEQFGVEQAKRTSAKSAKTMTPLSTEGAETSSVGEK